MRRYSIWTIEAWGHKPHAKPSKEFICPGGSECEGWSSSCAKLRLTDNLPIPEPISDDASIYFDNRILEALNPYLDQMGLPKSGKRGVTIVHVSDTIINIDYRKTGMPLLALKWEDPVF